MSAAKDLLALTTYLESLPEPHILFDSDYRIGAANAAYRAQFAQGASVIGRTCFDVSHGSAVPCDQAGESCPLAVSRQSGQRERVLHLHHTPKGEAYVSIELTPLPGAEGEPRYFIEKMEMLSIAKGNPNAVGLVGRSAHFRSMLALVSRVGPSSASVMILGESGTGKELVASAIHEASTRAKKPLVAVDCASLAESLFESELFGHEKGAFTGAQTARAGLIEAANGGTLFLDEVGDIPLTIQVKLLRLLESGTYRRVGGSELRQADVRLISATHRDLDAMVADGQFREDLFYRLNTFPVAVPSLRDRLDDLPLLIDSLLRRIAPQRALTLSPQAIHQLAMYSFPGNIRELRNLLERAVVLANDDVVSGDVMLQALRMGHQHLSRDPGLTGKEIDRAHVQKLAARYVSPAKLKRAAQREKLRAALERHPHDRQALASALGISMRTLYRRLEELNRGS